MEGTIVKKPFKIIAEVGSSLIFSILVIIVFEHYWYKIDIQSLRDDVAERVNYLESEIQLTMSEISAIRNFYIASESVSEQHFEAFSSPAVEKHSGIIALSYIESVPDSNRTAYENKMRSLYDPGFEITVKDDSGALVRSPKKDFYYVVTHITPLDANRSALGFDIGSNAVRYAALETASRTGLPVGSDVISLVQLDESQLGFLVVLPIIPDSSSLDPSISFHNKSHAFVSAVYQVQPLVETTMKRIGWSKLQLEIFDVAHGDTVLIFKNGTKSLSYPSLARKEPLQNTHKISFAEKEWIVIFSPTPDWHLSHNLVPKSQLYLIIFLVVVISQTIVIRLYNNKKLVQNTAQELRQFIETANAPIFGIDANGKVNEWNDTAAKITGFTKDEVLGRDLVKEFITDDYQKNVKAVLDDALQGKEASNYEFPLFTKDQRRLMVLLNASTRRNIDGNITGVLGVGQDITELERFREKAEVDRMKTDFLSMAAHELRTPLTSIQGFSEIMLSRQNIDTKQRQRYLGLINKQALRLGEIINDLLDISRIEAGKSFTIEKESCIIGESIELVAEPFIVQSKIHKFEIMLPDKSIELNVDKEKMDQVLRNLLSNAVKYSPDGGKIQIKGKLEKDSYHVSVQDEGLGMSPEQVDKIFDKFYRADTGNTAIEGTGLGMNIVKHIIEAHDGEIRVESEPKIGTKVTFILPLKQT
ncbi:MAG: PAS domain-containing protein [Candidatus Marinimicrobia bacterium]|nr:PAS domain-containing protein [Candidatus Neomarinimicrobiota bacterium]MBT6555009.1 PAS domain-containing protein [Candidatus Neomarinimicrobiota bacterium]